MLFDADPVFSRFFVCHRGHSDLELNLVVCKNVRSKSRSVASFLEGVQTNKDVRVCFTLQLLRNNLT